MSRFDENFFNYFNQVKNFLKLQPLNLGGVTSISGGAGGPPGGFVGLLPQTRVAYDQTEAEVLGYINPGAVDASGVVVSATLLDNLNHIRYRLAILEDGTGIVLKEDNVLVASGITILNFVNAEVTDDGGGQVSILTSGGSGEGASSFLLLSDTPASYGSQTGKAVVVNGAENGLEFSTVVSDTKQSKVSSDDTTENYLEDKIVAGSNVTVSVLNPGGNEQLSIAASIGATTFLGLTDTPSSFSGQGGKFVRVNSTPNALEFISIEERHTVQDEGTPLTSRPNLNFIGDGVAVTDNPGNDATDITITISGGGLGAPGFQTLSVPPGSGIINWNLSLGSALVQIDGEYTLANPTNLADGEFYFLKVQQGPAGAGILYWGDDYWFPQTLTPSLTTVASGIDIIDFRSDGTYLYGNHVGTKFTNIHVPILTVTDNLVLWLRPEELSSTYSNGDPIDTWTDHSGNNNDMDQTGSARPTFITDVINGYGVARFDATDDSLIGTVSFANPFTLFVVYSYRSASSQARRALNGSNNWLVGPRLGYHQYYNGDFIQGPAIVQNDFVLCTVIQNVSGADFRVDKASEGTNAFTVTPGTLHLAYNGDTPELLDGDIVEVLGYSVELSSTDIDTVEDYLWTKYNLASN